MLQTLKNWLRQRRKKAAPRSNAATPTPKIVAEQVHLHWHVSDASPIPGQVTWNAQPIVSFEPAAKPIEIKPAEHAAFDEALLDRARTQWQFGDWESLAALTREEIEGHPEKAKLALLVGAGCLQVGQSVKAREFVNLAKEWGASKKLIGQVLIAGVHNSLGRAAALAGKQSRANQHFESAIAASMPGSAVELLAQARVKHELDALGLLPDSQGRLQQYQALADIVDQTGRQLKATVPVLSPTSEAHAFYIKLGQEREPVPFLLIDSKSLPRSGLHYLKNTLGKLFGESFSFCEWYQEPGCCRKMPCALTGFADHAKETGHLRIRLVKSHDFALTDPLFKTNVNVRRLVLVRDPLYVLTSWFAITQLSTHETILAQNGINIKKIWLAHEKEVLKPAYQLLDEHFNPPSLQELSRWLEQKSQYITDFIDKWVTPAIDMPKDYIQIVRYEEINAYIDSLVQEYKPFVSDTAAVALNKEISLAGQSFKMREDPFVVPSKKVSEYIRNHSMLFDEVALRIKEIRK